MTQTDQAPSLTDYAAATPLRLIWPCRVTLSRAIRRLAGFGLLLSIPGLLIFGIGLDPALFPLKLMLAAFFAVLGLYLLSQPDMVLEPEMVFDPDNRELRIRQPAAAGQAQAVLRYRYDDLGGVILHDGDVQVFDREGEKVLEMPVTDRLVHDALQAQLSAVRHS